MTLRFACGHAMDVDDDVTAAPSCAVCGASRITRVQARPPRFVGVCTGPCATPQALAPWSQPLKGDA